MAFRHVLAALVLCGSSALAVDTPETFDTPGGAHCVVALPAGQPNGKLLLIAHGFVPDARPLTVNLRPDDPVYRRLLDAGWTVAATSYRRNGLILADAAADLELLRKEVVARHGAMPIVLVEGTSMGGFIATMLAENPPDPSYRGVLALGAALELDLPGETVPRLTKSPQLPILFLSTQDELASPTKYTASVAARDVGPALAAIVWKVTRDGHVNLNRAEVGAALDALDRWVADPAHAVPEAARDATLPPPPRPLTAEFSADGRSLTGHVIDVDPVYGNLTIDFRPEDVDKLGWRKGEWAPLQIADLPEPAPTLRGSTFGDVKEGAWVTFPTADGTMLVCRNFADAAATAKAKAGSTVSVTRPKSD